MDRIQMLGQETHSKTPHM